MEIRYLKYSEIDKTKWDKLIESSPQTKIYAYSWYLDCVADHWDALIAGDYEEVFPLPWDNKLFGYKKIFQPLLSQQLGLFTLNKTINQTKLESYLNAIPEHFKLIDIFLNDANQAPNLKLWKVEKRVNMELDLSNDYDTIQKGYDVSRRNSLKKSSNYNLEVSDSITITEFIEIHYKYNRHKIKGYNSSKKSLLQKIILNTIKRNKGMLKVVKDNQGRVHAVKLFLNSSWRIYNLLGVSTDIGRKSIANNYLLDHIIKENANSNYILDFEGSMLPGVAAFFRGFGVTEKTYYRVTRNQLPLWIRILLKVFKK